MLRKTKSISRFGAIMLMLVLLIIGIGGVVKSYTTSVPVSLTVPTSSLEISGYAAPNALVTIYDGASPTATATADADGQFVKLINSIASGLHSISVSQQDPNGVESSTANRVISIPPQQLTQIEFALPPTITSSSNNAKEGDTITITGYAEKNKSVQLFLDNQILPYGSTTTDNNGKYSFIINTVNFYFGSHNVKVKSTSSIGLTNFSKILTFNVERKESERPTDSPYNAPGYTLSNNNVSPPSVTTPPNSADIIGDKATISGQSEPNARIVININGQVVGSVYADSTGSWVFEFYPTEVLNVVTAITCLEDVCSEPSEPIEFYFRVLGAAVCKDTFSLEKYRFSTNTNKPINLDTNFDFNKAQTIVIDWGDVSTEKFTVVADTKIASYEHLYTKQGQYNGRITSALDSDNCLVTKYFTVQVNQDTSGIIPVQFLWTIVGGLLLALAFYIRDRYKKEISKNLQRQ